jgi:hypothetical protein
MLVWAAHSPSSFIEAPTKKRFELRFLDKGFARVYNGLLEKVLNIVRPRRLIFFFSAPAAAAA